MNIKGKLTLKTWQPTLPAWRNAKFNALRQGISHLECQTHKNNWNLNLRGRNNPNKRTYNVGNLHTIMVKNISHSRSFIVKSYNLSHFICYVWLCFKVNG